MVFAQIMNINESPVFLLLDTDLSRKHKDLPVSLYESGAPTWAMVLHVLQHFAAMALLTLVWLPQSYMQWMGHPRQSSCSPSTLYR